MYLHRNRQTPHGGEPPVDEHIGRDFSRMGRVDSYPVDEAVRTGFEQYRTEDSPEYPIIGLAFGCIYAFVG